MGNNIKNPMGILKVYIKAFTTKDRQMVLHQVNSLAQPLDTMEYKIEKLDEEIEKIKNNESEGTWHNLALMLVPKAQKIENINDVVEMCFTMKNIQKIEYEIKGDIGMVCIYEEGEKFIEEIINLWLNMEEPALYGRQVLINSYLLKDFAGRKIIGAYPSYGNQDWNLLLDGGVKLSLGNQGMHLNQNITSEDFSRWTGGELSNILNDPCYTYGIIFRPMDIFYEWNKMLIYGLALLPTEETTKSNLEKIYDEFIEFIKNEVCEWEKCPTIISKKMWIDTLCVKVEEMRKELRGKEQAALSKNDLILLGNRYIYMIAIREIISKYCQVENYSEEFDKKVLNDFLNNLEKDTTYEKGLAMETLAEYFLKSIPEIQITGKRVKTEKEEIDLCFCNNSLDENLWKLGVLTFVECKNEKSKFSSAQLKKIVQTMDEKGSKSIVLFLRNGLTNAAVKELYGQLIYGKYIIVITTDDLQSIGSMTPYELLVNKIEELDQMQSDALEKWV